MAVSLHEASIPQFRQTIGAMRGLIDKAEAFCAERGLSPDTLIDARLSPDMLPFGYQVKSVTVHSAGAIDGLRAGTFAPDRTAWPTDFAGLRARLDEADAALAAVTPEELNALEDGELAFVLPNMRLEFTATAFLLSFSLPNFYFHATTAYDILRAQGVGIGKRDFLGAMQLRQPPA